MLRSLSRNFFRAKICASRIGFCFIPGTIGAITWLARNREQTARIRHGLVLTGIGDSGGFHYKKSRQGSAEIDRAVAHVLRHYGEPL